MGVLNLEGSEAFSPFPSLSLNSLQLERMAIHQHCYRLQFLYSTVVGSTATMNLLGYLYSVSFTSDKGLDAEARNPW